ncbi:hypothetical protein Trydic_g10426 [Trypoxylus dichotomus]
MAETRLKFEIAKFHVYKTDRVDRLGEGCAILVKRIGDQADYVLISGDLNSKHRSWNSRVDNRNGTLLRAWLELQEEFDVASQSDPTYFSSTGLFDPDVFDISVLKDWTFPLRCYMVQELSSDHYPAIMETISICKYVSDRRGTEKVGVRKEFERTRYSPLKEETNRLKREIQKDIEAYRLKLWDDFVQKSQGENPRRVSIILKKEKKPMPEILHGQYFRDQEKAKALADTFATQFSPNYRNDAEQESVFQSTQEEFDEMDPDPSIVISPREVLAVIKGIPQRKSPGGDGISNGALKNLPLKLLVNLTTIFNAVLRLMCYPPGWKSARIALVPKPNRNHHCPEGYHPIPLFCTIKKALESLLLARISDHLDEHRLLDDD